MTPSSRPSPPDLSGWSLDELRRRRGALASYRFSMMRICEESAAADRAELQVVAALSALDAEIRRRAQNAE